MLGIIVCTRNRTDQLSSLLKSIENNCVSPDNLDVWIGFDSDDSRTREFLDSCSFSFKINRYVNDNKSAECRFCDENFINRHKDVINPMAFSSEADIFWVLNDDVTIETKGFDKIIEDTVEQHLKEKEYRIFYGMCKVNFAKELPPYLERVAEAGGIRLKTTYACYPIVTKELVYALGYLLSPEFPDDAADIMLGKTVGASWFNRKYSVPVTVSDSVTKEEDVEKRIRPRTMDYGWKDNFLKEIINGQKCHHMADLTAFSTVVQEGLRKLNAIIEQKFLYQESISLKGLDIDMVYECSDCGIFIKVPGMNTSTAITCSFCGSPSILEDIAHDRLALAIESTSNNLQALLLKHKEIVGSSAINPEGDS
jgi:DNA-directed RNA polymerase subunit RPC12/RpoP